MYPNTFFNAHPAEMPQCLADDPPIRSPPLCSLVLCTLEGYHERCCCCNTLAASWNMMKHVNDHLNTLKLEYVRILPPTFDSWWCFNVFSLPFARKILCGYRSTEELLCGLTIRKSLRSGGRAWMTMPKDVARAAMWLEWFDFRNRCRKCRRFLYSIAIESW